MHVELLTVHTVIHGTTLYTFCLYVRGEVNLIMYLKFVLHVYVYALLDHILVCRHF